MNLALKSAYELLPLGTPITYHHRAATARHQRCWQPHKDYPREEVPRGWKLKEGLYSDEKIPRGMGEGTSGDNFIGPDAEYVTVRWQTVAMGKGILAEPSEDREDRFYNLKDVFHNWPQAHNDRKWGGSAYNKTVFVWPAQGNGFIIGLVRKGIGTSSSSHYYSGGYYGEPDYDQGYLACDMYVDLYVVKERYEGTEWILCPLWGVKEKK